MLFILSFVWFRTDRISHSYALLTDWQSRRLHPDFSDSLALRVRDIVHTEPRYNHQQRLRSSRSRSLVSKRRVRRPMRDLRGHLHPGWPELPYIRRAGRRVFAADWPTQLLDFGSALAVPPIFPLAGISDPPVSEK